MLTIEPKSVTNSFINFASQASRILHINRKEDYECALQFVEYLIDITDDSKDNPINDLILIISNAINEYESNQDDIIEFEISTQNIDPGISMLRHLIDQYGLKLSDFKEEIGSKTLISLILNGKRSLTKEHITNLSKRFSVSPSLFFEV